MDGKWSSFIYVVTTPNLLMYWLILESNLPKLPSFSKSYFCSYSCSTSTWFLYLIIYYLYVSLLIPLRDHYVDSRFNTILIMCLRNHFVVSILIRLRNHCVISQFDPILIIRLRNHYVVYQFDPILIIRLRNYYVVSQRLCISESK